MKESLVHNGLNFSNRIFVPESGAFLLNRFAGTSLTVSFELILTVRAIRAVDTNMEINITDRLLATFISTTLNPVE